jgi:hypothetical protein
LNCSFDGATLVAAKGKPFDVLAEGLVFEKSRGDRTAIELFLNGLAEFERMVRKLLGP